LTRAATLSRLPAPAKDSAYALAYAHAHAIRGIRSRAKESYIRQQSRMRHGACDYSYLFLPLPPQFSVGFVAHVHTHYSSEKEWGLEVLEKEGVPAQYWRTPIVLPATRACSGYKRILKARLSIIPYTMKEFVIAKRLCMNVKL
jgi:hypothetical protein